MTNDDKAGARRAARQETRARGAAGVLALVLCAFFLAAAVLAPAGPARATPMVVTSLGDFNSAVGAAPTTGDDFSPNVAGGRSITFASGVVSTAIGGDPFLLPIANNIISGSFDARLTPSGFFPSALTWTFPLPVMGFGLDFFLPDSVAVTIPGTGLSFDIEAEIGGPVGFFGLVDTMAPFTQIRFSALSSNSTVVLIETLIFAAAPTVTAVPEPASLALFALGLAGLAGLGYRRRRRAP